MATLTLVFFIIIYKINAVLFLKLPRPFTQQVKIFTNSQFFEMPRIELFFKNLLKGKSHKKVGKMRVWGVSLGPN
jgi:hypothetical protein